MIWLKNIVKGYLLPALMGLLVALSLVSAFMLWRVRSVQAQNASLQTALGASQIEVAKLQREQEAAKVSAEEFARIRVALEAKEGKSRVIVQAAVQSNPDWSNERVPAAVVDGLRNSN